MKKIIFLCFLSIVLFKNESQSQIAFSKEYGGQYHEDGRWMEQMPDSGFILTGGTTTYSNGQTDFWLVRTDAYGNTLWTKSIGGTAFDFANMVKPLPDGFVIVGVTNRTGSDDAIIVKTNLSGITQWTTVLGDGNIQWFEGVIPTFDGGLACVGVNTGAGTHGTYDIYLVKFNSTGVMQWQKSIGGQSYEIGNSIQQTADSGFILSGQTYSYGEEDGDYYLVKTDAQGNVDWEQTYDETGLQECHYAQITPDGGYIMVGDADDLQNSLGSTDVWVIRTDEDGDKIWEGIYGGTKKDGGKTIENTSDGGFIIAGITRSFNLIDPNYYLIKTDSLGAMEWQVTSYGTSHHDHAYRGIETSDGGYAEFGFFRNSANIMNFSLVKLGPNGGITKDIAVDDIIAPELNLCRSNGVNLQAKLTNYGATNEQNIQVTISIDNGGPPTLLTDTFVGSLAPGASTVLTFSQTFDFNVDDTFNLRGYTIHRNSDISYTNDSTARIVVVVPPTADPVTTSGVRCSNGSLTLTSTAAASTDSMFWYDAASGGDLIFAGSSYTTPSLNNTETYYVKSIKGKGSKVGMVDNSAGSGSNSSGNYLKFDSRREFKLVSVLVYPQSSGNRTIQLRNSGGTVLKTKTINLPSAPGGIRVYLDFDVPEGNDLQLYLTSGSSSLFRNSSGAVFPYSVSQTVEIYGTNSSTLGTYYYFYDWYVFVPGENCESNSIPVQALISPTNVTAFDRERCGNGPVTLTANSNSSLEWYSSSSGGSVLDNGNSFTTPSLSSTTTYYLEVGSCPNRIPVDAIINSVSSQPTANDVTHCGPGAVTLSATSPDPISWYNAPANGTLSHSGNPFTTPYLTATKTYYAVAGTDCPSTPVAVSAIINGANPPTTAGATACGPAFVTLNATSSDPIRWYNVATGGSPIATTSSYTTPVLGTPTTYYVEAGTVCPSARVAVVANVNTTDPPVGINASRCGTGSVVISASSLNSVTWWTLANGGTQVGSGINFSTPSLGSTTNYYAMATASGCNSVRTQVTATIDITDPPTLSPGAHCGPGTVTLTAVSSDTVYWFTSSSGGSPVHTGLSYTTPSISTTTTYYAQALIGCPSTRMPVDAIITSQAANPNTTDSSRCGSGTVMLTATSSDPITWYDAPGGNIVGTGATFVTPVLSTTTTYYAVAGVTGCVSTPIATIATINPLPDDPITTGDDNCGPAQLTLSATAPDPMTWYSQASGGTVITTGTSYTSNFTTTTTYYVEASNGTCSSNRIPVTAIIKSVPNVNLGPPTVTISSGTTITLDAGPGVIYAWSTGASSRTINVNTTGTYFVTVTNANGCQGSDTIVVNVTTSIGVNPAIDNSLQIYPNPTNGEFHVVVNNPGLSFRLRIIDVTGRIILTDSNRDGSFFIKTFDLSQFAKGAYYLQLLSDEGNATRTLIIQ